jgi:magnesium-transporting ATPase (P-type)
MIFLLIQTGIRGDQHDLDERTRLFGSNKIKVRQVKTVLELLMEPFEDRILQILIAAAVVSLICGVAQHGWNGLIEGVSILMSICIIVSVTATNNYIKEKQFQELQQKQDVTSAIVVRNSVTKTVSSEELVVGDVVVVETGKVVPADCVLFEAIEMTVNESTLTGETVSVNKQHVTPQNYSSNPSPFLLSSTLVETGKGLALVCAVGDHTCAGKANRALDIENEATPL